MTGRARRDAIWEAAIAQRAEDAALFRDVGLAHLGSHVYAAAEIAKARAAESGDDSLDARLTAILAALRSDFEIRLTRVEAAVRAEGR